MRTMAATYCFTFQKSIKSQLSDTLYGQKNYCFTFQKSIKSQLCISAPPRLCTVSHFKRASNHNFNDLQSLIRILFHISKEHQITTCGVRLSLTSTLFHISKEHQITTTVITLISPATLFHISKEHQITTRRRLNSSWTVLFHISKEHQITTRLLRGLHSTNCFTFQKSIKSQLGEAAHDGPGTVSHFKRASNHNKWTITPAINELFHISKEHQITTSARLSGTATRLFHISKEHQIAGTDIKDQLPNQGNDLRRRPQPTFKLYQKFMESERQICRGQ